MSLIKYANTMLDGRHGWRTRYEAALAGPFTDQTTEQQRIARYICLVAHYERLLDELVKVIGGPAAVLELLDARARIDALTKSGKP
jgi:hypothetical protein